jgi:hypothetical protein
VPDRGPPCRTGTGNSQRGRDEYNSQIELAGQPQFPVEPCWVGEFLLGPARPTAGPMRDAVTTVLSRYAIASRAGPGFFYLARPARMNALGGPKMSTVASGQPQFSSSGLRNRKGRV